MVRRSTAALILGLLALPLLRPAAQEAEAGEPAEAGAPAEAAQPAAEEETRRLLLCFELASDANFTQEEELLLYESLLVQLGSASRKVAVLEAPDRKPTASNSDRSTLARSLGGDSWLLVSLSGDLDLREPRGRLLRPAHRADRLRLPDAQEPAARGGGPGAGLLGRDPGSGRWTTTARRRPPRSLPGQVVFQAPPGTRIAVAGTENLRTDPSGRASLSVQLPLTLSIRARRPGFYPLESKYYVSQELTTLELQQARGARFAFDVYLNNVIFPGFEFSWFPLPNTLFLRTGFTTYLAGLFFSGSGEETSIFVSKTLNLLDLGDRRLPERSGPAPARLRRNRRIPAPDHLHGYWGLEPIAPWGLQAILGLEYSRKLKQRFYLEFDPLLYFTNHPDLLFASFPPDHDAGRLRSSSTRPPLIS